jgi:hypothetical protein
MPTVGNPNLDTMHTYNITGLGSFLSVHMPFHITENFDVKFLVNDSDLVCILNNKVNKNEFYYLSKSYYEVISDILVIIDNIVAIKDIQPQSLKTYQWFNKALNQLPTISLAQLVNQ